MKKVFSHLFLLLSAPFLFAQVGIGTSTPKATLDVVGNPDLSTNTDGILVPRISGAKLRAKNSSYTHEHDGALVYVTSADPSPATKTINVIADGFYYYKQPLASDTGIWVAAKENKFFYLPSVILPINSTGVPQHPAPNVFDITYDATTQVYTVNLYEIYKHQFATPIRSSNNRVITASEVLDHSNKYEYHILFADKIFTDINFLTGTGNEGKFTYKINPAIIVKNPPFMNIVMKAK